MSLFVGKKIMIIDDDDRLRSRLERSFQQRGLVVSSAANHKEALECYAQTKPDLVVIDLKLQESSGLQLLTDLQKMDPYIQAIILTGYGSITTAVDAIRIGAVNYLQKPADAEGILFAFTQKTTSDSLQQKEPEYQPPSLHQAEWEHIQRVLHDCGGNISTAAEKLGLHRRTLQRKLKKVPPPKNSTS